MPGAVVSLQQKPWSKMNDMERTGKLIIIIGVGIVLVGLIVWLFGDKLKWVGRLPGDIRVEKENFHFYMPITTMILLSVLLSVVVWVVKHFSK